MGVIVDGGMDDDWPADESAGVCVGVVDEEEEEKLFTAPVGSMSRSFKLQRQLSHSKLHWDDYQLILARRVQVLIAKCKHKAKPHKE